MRPEPGGKPENAAPEPGTNSISELQDLARKLGALHDRQQAITASAPNSSEMAAVIMEQQDLLDQLRQQLAARESEQVRSRALQEVAATINSSLDLEQVLNRVMDMIISLTHAERAMLLLFDESSGDLEVQAARNVDRETIEESDSFQISMSIARAVADSGSPVVTMNAQDDTRFSAEESIISYGLRSILCVPLKIKEDIIGVIYADNRIASGIFDENHRDLLAAFANQAAVAIDNARLFQETRRNLAEITEMKDLMDNVFASVDGGIITIDDSGLIALFNRAAATILNVSAEAVLEQHYQPALELMGLPVQSVVAEVKASGKTLVREIDIQTENATGPITLDLTFSPLRDMRGRTLGVALVLDDISEQKRLESVRRYLPPSLVDKVRDLDAVQQPQSRTLTVLFADLRGFTPYSEAREPEKLIEVINGYFDQAVKAITYYQGFTDKFMGDAVMALFNTPLNPQSDHVMRALQTAVMIQERLAFYRRQLPEDRHLHFGIGVHTGTAVVGNVGSELRKDYSAIGDAVNLAKRLQENALPDQVLISAAVYDLARQTIKVTRLEPLKVKGRQATEQVYALHSLTFQSNIG